MKGFNWILKNKEMFYFIPAAMKGFTEIVSKIKTRCKIPY